MRKFNLLSCLILIGTTLFHAGCDEPPEPEYFIRSIQGITRNPVDIGFNQSVVRKNLDVFVIGRGFGDQAGTLSIGDDEVVTLMWTDSRIRFRTPNDRALNGAVMVTTHPDGGSIEISGPTLIAHGNYNGENPLQDAYREHVQAYAAANGLNNNPDFPDWEEWMTSPARVPGLEAPLEVFSRAYQRQLAETGINGIKTITISYNYSNDVPLRLLKTWGGNQNADGLTPGQLDIQEAAHMAKVELLLEAALPTYEVRVIKGLEPELADIVVESNLNGRQKTTRGPYEIQGQFSFARIQISFDMDLAHEIGHFLLGWGDHHCVHGNCITQEPGNYMPPTTLDQVQECTMDRTNGTWCNACAAALGIPLSALNPEQFENFRALRNEFLGRYALVR